MFEGLSDKLSGILDRLTRRGALMAGAAASASIMLPRYGGAQTRLDITQGNFQPMPIAIPKFVGGGDAETAGDGGDVATGVTQVITANLQRSGLFAPIDPTAYLEQISSVDTVPNFPNWRTINAQALVTGRVARQGDGRLKAEFRLWDVPAGQQLTARRFSRLWLKHYRKESGGPGAV